MAKTILQHCIRAVIVAAMLPLSSCTVIDAERTSCPAPADSPLARKKEAFQDRFCYVPGEDFERHFIDMMPRERTRLQSLPIRTFEDNPHLERCIVYLEKHLSDRAIWPYYIKWMNNLDGEHGYLEEYYICWLMYSDMVGYEDFRDFAAACYASDERLPYERQLSMRAITEHILTIINE